MKYKHDEIVHNTNSAAEIVPVIMKLINPGSVVDIGCGTGTFLKVFKEYKVAEVLGYDGSWVNRDLLLQNISLNEFREADLEAGIKAEKKFDLAVCLEVGEHLDEKAADTLVKNLCDFSDNVLFSAAIPGQGGQNHINEQYVEYWQKKFNNAGYTLYDVLRPVLWKNAKVNWWYRQNMVLYSKKNEILDSPYYQSIHENRVLTIAHPVLVEMLSNNLNRKSKILNDIYLGKLSLVDYLKLFVKAAIIKLGLKKMASGLVKKMPGAGLKHNPYGNR